MDPESVDLDEVFRQLSHTEDDFVDVKGQDYAKRALLIAAAGCHNVLMIGPPGTGKTLLAKRLPTILPPLTPAESLETTRIYSAMGLLKPGQPLMAVRPFRPPHHSVSDAGLVGGGTTPQPGEISLAHKGVLFLDEMPEFNRKTLEVLRQPLEEGEVTISRALRSTTFPAEFILVAAMNPCPCGYRSDPRRACSCTPPQVEKYLSKISGPLLDRIDLHVEVPAVPFTQLAEMPPGPTSADLRAQVLEARARQAKRFGPKGPQVNGRMTPRQVRKFCPLKPEAMSLLQGGDGRAGPLGPRPRQGAARGAHDRRPGRARRHQAAAHRRGGGVSVARSERVDVESCREAVTGQPRFSPMRRAGSSSSGKDRRTMLVAGTMLGPYRITGPLGTGGIGESRMAPATRGWIATARSRSFRSTSSVARHFRRLGFCLTARQAVPMIE